MKILGLRRRPELSRGDPCLEAALGPQELHRLLAQSDYVVITAPATRQTRGLMGKAEFAVMKSSAVLINVGRGSSVDETALIDALERGRIRGAALDVYETDLLPPGTPFTAWKPSCYLRIVPITLPAFASWIRNSSCKTRRGS